MTRYVNGSRKVYDTKYWKDQLNAGSSLGVGAAAPARTQLGSSNIYYAGYGVGDGFSTEIQFNHDAVQGASVIISPHVHLMLPVAPSSGDQVNLSFHYTFASIDGTFSGSPTTDAKETLLTGKSQYQHLYIEFADITVTMGISSIILCGVKRIAASAQEYGNDVAVVGFDFHYKVDAPGSVQETVK
jgi:hypothetical protein